MVTIRELHENEFNAIRMNSPFVSWLQSCEKAQLDKVRGYDPHLLGFYESDSDKAIGCCRVTIRKAKIAPFGEAIGGVLFVDHIDAATEAESYKALSQWAKGKHLTHVRVMPIEPYQVFDGTGSALSPDTDINLNTIDSCYLEPSEDRVAHYSKILDEFSGPRDGYLNELAWMFVKELSQLKNEQDLLNSYSKNTRRNLKLAQKPYIKLENLDASGVDRFYAQYSMAREKHEFHDNRPISYFGNLISSFGQDIELKVVYLDIQEYKASWLTKIEEFENNISRLEANLVKARKPERIKKQLEDAKSKLEAAQKRLKEAEEYEAQYGITVDLAASLFLYSPNESIYFLSGSDPKFAHLYAQTLLQHEVMCKDIELGIPRHNFYGISGYFGKDDEGYGVLSFKQGFGGYTVQLIGAGNVVGNSFTYRLKKLLKRGR